MYVYDDNDGGGGGGGETAVLQGGQAMRGGMRRDGGKGKGVGALALKGPRLGVWAEVVGGTGESIDVPGALGRSLQSQRGPWWQHPDFLPRLPTTHTLLVAMAFVFASHCGPGAAPLLVHCMYRLRGSRH